MRVIDYQYLGQNTVVAGLHGNHSLVGLNLTQSIAGSHRLTWRGGGGGGGRGGKEHP